MTWPVPWGTLKGAFPPGPSSPPPFTLVPASPPLDRVSAFLAPNACTFVISFIPYNPCFKVSTIIPVLQLRKRFREFKWFAKATLLVIEGVGIQKQVWLAPCPVFVCFCCSPGDLLLPLHSSLFPRKELLTFLGEGRGTLS